MKTPPATFADAARPGEAERPRAGAPGSWGRLLLAGILAGVVAGALPADTITKTDGTVLTGRVLSEDERAVEFEIDRYGAKMVVSVRRKDIRSIVRAKLPPRKPPATKPASAPAGPTYYPLPIAGTIGHDVLPNAFAQALNDARSRKPDVVVLYFDSFGGTGEGLKAMLDVLARNKDLRIVALVRRALSAAAVCAMGCREIYMTPDGTIGNVAVLTVAPDGTPQTMPARLRSQVRALCRSAAQMGGHSDLLMRGMMDPELELVVVTDRGRPKVAQGSEGKVLKRRGSYLTLTAREAVACGLAKGTAESVETLHAALGIDQWHRARGGGWYLMTQRGKENRLRLEREARRAAREAYLKEIQPELDRLASDLAAVRASGRAAEADLANFKKEYDLDRRRVRLEYRDDLRRADAYEEVDPDLAARLRARARDAHELKLLEVKRRYDLRTARGRPQINRLAAEQARILTERKKLLATVPK